MLPEGPSSSWAEHASARASLTAVRRSASVHRDLLAALTAAIEAGEPRASAFFFWPFLWSPASRRSARVCEGCARWPSPRYFAFSVNVRGPRSNPVARVPIFRFSGFCSPSSGFAFVSCRAPPCPLRVDCSARPDLVRCRGVGAAPHLVFGQARSELASTGLELAMGSAFRYAVLSIGHMEESETGTALFSVVCRARSTDVPTLVGCVRLMSNRRGKISSPTKVREGAINHGTKARLFSHASALVT